MGNGMYALSGVKVVELGTHVVVPTATRVLADFGAEVIKIENLLGEEWRYVGKNLGVPVTTEENAVFTNQNSNKKFIALDLKTEDGLAVLERLIEQADIFCTNVRQKALEKMGIDFQTLKERFPKLIYCHFTGFGYEGPDKDRPGFDMAAFWARSGALADWANIGSFPAKPIGAFGDSSSANFIINGMLMALYARERTGLGTLVSSSLYGSSIWLNSIGIITAQEPYNIPYPTSRFEPALPLSHIFECKGGDYIIMTIIDYEPKREFAFKLLGMEEYLDDVRFDTLEHTRENLEAFVKIVNEKFLAKTRDEWAEYFKENGVVYEKLVHYKEVPSDIQASANNYLQDITFQSGTTIKMTRYPLLMSEYDSKPISPSAQVGRDTKAVLSAAGYSEDQILEMEKNKAVVTS